MGNHEFDIGSEGLAPFLNAVDFPVLAANLDLSQDAVLLSTHKIKKSTVLEVNATKVGIIGYVTPKTKEDSSTAAEFNEEIESIK